MINSLTLYQCHLANSLRCLIVQILLGTTVALINGKRRYRIEEISFISIWGVGLVRRTLWPLFSVFPSGEVNQKGWKTLHGGIRQNECNPRRLCWTRENCREKCFFFLFGVWRMLQPPEIEIFVNAFTYHPKYGGLCPRESVPLQTQFVIGEQNDKIYSANSTPNPDNNRKCSS